MGKITTPRLALLVFMLLAGSLNISAADKVKPADPVKTAELYVGVAEKDITPELPVALMGQFHLRIAERVNTPLSANIIAVETRNGTEGNDTVVFVSCDLIWISQKLWDQVRGRVKQALPGFDVEKIVLNGTHTHTAPVIEDSTDQDAYFYYDIPAEGVTRVADYRRFLVGQISAGIVAAWQRRERGSVTWGLGRAAVGYNRRVVYSDGTAVMYGKTDTANFKCIEGYEDHDIQALFFWNKAGSLIGTSVNIACPSQENESRNVVDADFWHPVRQQLKQIYGSGLVIAGWTGAAGDQSPRPVYRRAAIERMEELAGETPVTAIADRIVYAVKEIYEVVKNDKRPAVYLAHQTKEIRLPQRRILTAEYAEAEETWRNLSRQIKQDPGQSAGLYTKMKWNRTIMDRFKEQETAPASEFSTEIHVIRMGEVAICTNQFELFTDYGIQIKARSDALQTFIIQLAGPGTYLPTQKAVSGGGYSAVCQSNMAGPEGGRLLVEATLELLNGMWKPESRD